LGKEGCGYKIWIPVGGLWSGLVWFYNLAAGWLALAVVISLYSNLFSGPFVSFARDEKRGWDGNKRKSTHEVKNSA
jgi:hypothetical protein